MTMADNLVGTYPFWTPQFYPIIDGPAFPWNDSREPFGFLDTMRYLCERTRRARKRPVWAEKD